MAIELHDQGALAHHDPTELLRRLVAGFLAGYRGNTRSAYQGDLKNWFAWCEEQELHPLEAARSHAELYLRGLEALGRKPATVARRCSTLAKFYEFVVDEEILDRSPMAKVRRPKVPEESPTLGLDHDPESDEFSAFMAAAARAPVRDYALVCLYALNGLRCSEACDTFITDLGEQRGHVTLRVHRKGGKTGVIPLSPRTAAAIAEVVGDRRSGAIFLDSKGTQLNRQQAYRIVRRIVRDAGITKRIHPHSLRHTFVTLALDAGIPLHKVQDDAGHADPRTTRRYDRARHQLDGHSTYALDHLLDPEEFGDDQEAPPA